MLLTEHLPFIRVFVIMVRGNSNIGRWHSKGVNSVISRYTPRGRGSTRCHMTVFVIVF